MDEHGSIHPFLNYSLARNSAFCYIRDIRATRGRIETVLHSTCPELRVESEVFSVGGKRILSVRGRNRIGCCLGVALRGAQGSRLSPQRATTELFPLTASKATRVLTRSSQRLNLVAEVSGSGLEIIPVV
jgi:hypothetical protein